MVCKYQRKQSIGEGEEACDEQTGAGGDGLDKTHLSGFPAYFKVGKRKIGFGG